MFLVNIASMNMRKAFLVTLALTAFAGLAGPAAQAQVIRSAWEASADDIKAAFPGVVAAPGINGRVIEIKAVAVGGVKWERVEFRFDAAGRLDGLKLITKARSYDQIAAELADANDPLWSIGSDDAARAPARNVMLCDYGAGGVALTFDQPQIALPKTILASLESARVSLQ